MPACQIEEFQDSPRLREELIHWLRTYPQWPFSEADWQRRLAHWWDENPFATLSSPRGWVLRHEGCMVGFMALIPTGYAVDGVLTAACMASSWRVDEPQRNASLPMLMKLRSLATSMLMVDTTPSDDVQVMLQKSGWRPCTAITRRFVPLGLAARPWRNKWPLLSAGRRLTRDPAEVKTLAENFQSPLGIEKWITPEYLRWFAAAPMRRHEFIGVIDGSGCLTSYVFVTPNKIRGIPAWMEVDHFTTEADFTELHALVGEIVRRPSLLGGERLLSLASFPGDPSWESAPVLHQRQVAVTHHFAIPKAIQGLLKRSVLAEGDWGL